MPQPESMTTADSGSVTVQATETSLVYQPCRPTVPVMTFVITGGVVSGGALSTHVYVPVIVDVEPEVLLVYGLDGDALWNVHVFPVGVSVAGKLNATEVLGATSNSALLSELPPGLLKVTVVLLLACPPELV